MSGKAQLPDQSNMTFNQRLFNMDDLLRRSADWQRSFEGAYSAAVELRAVAEAGFLQGAELHLLHATLPRRLCGRATAQNYIKN